MDPAGEEHKDLGLVVRARRRALDLSQETLGKRAGMHRTQVSSIERGGSDPTFRVVVRLAAALEMAPHELVEEVERRWTSTDRATP